MDLSDGILRGTDFTVADDECSREAEAAPVPEAALPVCDDIYLLRGEQSSC